MHRHKSGPSRNRDICYSLAMRVDASKLRVIADERERKSGIPDLLVAAGIRTEIKTLETGDYIVAPETVVERKSVRDLVSSVVDGRLDNQCSRLKSGFKNPVVVMEGGSDEVAKIIDNAFVFYAAVARVVVEFGISLIQTPDATHTAKLLVSLGTRNGAQKGMLLKRPHRKTGMTLRDQQLGVLCGLPGIGERLATRMLDRFGTLRTVVAATLAELESVDGLGAARAKRLHNVLRTRAGPPRRQGATRKRFRA